MAHQKDNNMTSRDFCFWLQGYFEVSESDAGVKSLSAAQVKMIKAHLNLVFKHEIDPSLGGDKHELAQIHSGGDSALNLIRC